MTDTSPSQADTQAFAPIPPEPEPTPPVNPAATEPIRSTGVTPGTGRARGSGWVNIALALAIAVAIGGIGFAAGRMTAPASVAGAGGNGRTFTGGQFPGGAQFPGGGYFQGGNGDDGGGFRGLLGAGGVSLEGTVESVSGDTLTLKLASGQTIQVSLGGTTTYHSQAAASSTDVKTGGTVIVRVQLGRGGQGTGPTSPAATDVTIVP